MNITKKLLMSWLDGDNNKEALARTDLKNVITWMKGETNPETEKEIRNEGYGWIYDLRKKWKKENKKR
ncbi:MAG: hypothetical protein V1900_03550 [Candidatus Aenigmatarchaeota archaeon]